MKNSCYFSALFLISILISTSLCQQKLEVYINKPAENNNSESTFSASSLNRQIGGLILPSIGTVNALIIFSQFPDDNYKEEDSLWPKGKPPADINKWVNETWTDTPIQGSLTHYFNNMSFNKFKFIGKTVSVTAPNKDNGIWITAGNAAIFKKKLF